jgi:hypothetical protein
MGTYSIIELRTFLAGCTSDRMDVTTRWLRPKLGPTTTAFIALVGYFGPPTTGVASARGEPPLVVAQAPETWQYHGFGRQQYHRIPRNLGHASASVRQVRRSGAVIPMLVISRSFAPKPPNAARKALEPTALSTARRIAPQKYRSIGAQVQPEKDQDLRTMVDIGAMLGLCYASFLGVWFWATRVRMRPRSSAPS